MSRKEEPITRIELTESLPAPNGVFVEKYRSGWTSSTYPDPDDIYRSDGKLEDMVAWLKDKGWQVLEWFDPNRGRRVRAFNGKMLPVRSASTIRWYRHEIGLGRIKVEDPSRDLRYWY